MIALVLLPTFECVSALASACNMNSIVSPNDLGVSRKI